jgi:hypothetical protein
MTIFTGNGTIRKFIKDWKETPENERSQIIRDNTMTSLFLILFIAPVALLYMIWTLVGLFTSQRVLFLALILLGFIAAVLPKTTFIKRVDAFISTIILFLIINSHFNP